MQENKNSSYIPSKTNEETTLDFIAQNMDDIIWKMDIDTMKNI